jgi:cell division protein FtsB
MSKNKPQLLIWGLKVINKIQLNNTTLTLILVNTLIIIFVAVNYKNLIIDYDNLEQQIVVSENKNKNLTNELQEITGNEFAYAYNIDLLEQRKKINAIINSLPTLKNIPQQSTKTGEIHYTTGNTTSVLLLAFKLVNSADVITRLENISIQDDKAALSYEIYGKYK